MFPKILNRYTIQTVKNGHYSKDNQDCFSDVNSSDFIKILSLMIKMLNTAIKNKYRIDLISCLSILLILVIIM